MGHDAPDRPFLALVETYVPTGSLRPFGMRFSALPLGHYVALKSVAFEPGLVVTPFGVALTPVALKSGR